MARWRTLTPHYLNILDPVTGEKITWEHKEQDQTTGRMNKKVYVVPDYIPVDTTVCHEGKGERGDTTFFGDPTPDMEPLDDEAEALSESMKHKWTHPIDTLPANGGMNEQESRFMAALMQAVGGQAPKSDDAKLKQLEDQLAEMRAMFQSLKPSSAIPEEKPAHRRA